MSQKREISPFICRELLYDYITGHLDHSRSTAVKECLEKFEEIKEDVQSIKSAISFCETLNTIQISQSIYKPLFNQTDHLQNIKGKWDEIPTTIRVTLGVSCLAAMFLFILQSPSVKNWGKEGQLVTVALNTKAQKETHDLLHEDGNTSLDFKKNKTTKDPLQGKDLLSAKNLKDKKPSDSIDTSKSSLPSNSETKHDSSNPLKSQDSSKQSPSDLLDTQKLSDKKQNTVKGSKLTTTKDSKTAPESLKSAQKAQLAKTSGFLEQKGEKTADSTGYKQKSAVSSEGSTNTKSPTPSKQSEIPDQKSGLEKQADSKGDKQKSAVSSEGSTNAKPPAAPSSSKKSEALGQKNDLEKQSTNNKQNALTDSTDSQDASTKPPHTLPSAEQIDSFSDLSQKDSTQEVSKAQTDSQKLSDKKQELTKKFDLAVPKSDGELKTDKRISELSPNTPTKLSDKSSTILKEEKPELKGLIFRIFLDVTQLDQATSKVISKIKSLDGKKAGRVSLGWKRKRDRYFHFSLPESNEPALMEYLKGLGSVRIIRDPHRRIMPKGTLRFILLIKKKTNNGSQEQQKNTSETL